MLWTFPTGLLTAAAIVLGGALGPPLSIAVAASFGAVGILCLFTCRALERRRILGQLRQALGVLGVITLGMGSGALRRAPEVPFWPSRDPCTLAGEVIEWRVHPAGVVLRLRVVDRDGVAVHPPVPVRVMAGATWGALPPSRWLRVTGRFVAERGSTTPGAPWGNPANAGTLAADAHAAPRWGPGRPDPVLAAQGRLSAAVRARLSGFSGRFGEAVLLGWSSSLTVRERDVFRRSGATHLVAVSGLNVGLAAGLVALLLAGAPSTVRLAGIVGSGWAYAAIAGWSPSVLRAAAGLSAVSLGNTLRRPRSGPAWLALALPWLLWYRPALVESVSFQLSVAAVAGLFLALDLCHAEAGRWRSVLTSTVACLGAQWGTLPITVTLFGTVSPLALLPNLIVVPLSGLFLPAILLTLCFSPWEAMAGTFAGASLVLARLIQETLEGCARWLPYWTGLPRPVTPVLCAFVAVPVAWFGLRPERRRLGRSRAGVAMAMVALAAGVFVTPGPPRGPWVAFLDVGQGDAAVLRLSDGSTWVVDVGDDRGPGDAARNVVLPFLRRQRVRRIDGVVLSHRHRDHTGALASFLEERPVPRIWDAGHGGPSGTSGWMDSLFAARGSWPCLVAAGDTLHAAPGVLVTALHPAREDPSGSAQGLNDRSIVLRIEDGSTVFLLVGDLESAGETECLLRGEALRADFLKVGHHGSRTSSSTAFLDAVAPRRAVISCGPENRFGHPDPGTLDKLRARGCATWRTDRDGSVIIRRSGDGSWEAATHPPRGAGERAPEPP